MTYEPQDLTVLTSSIKESLEISRNYADKITDKDIEVIVTSLMSLIGTYLEKQHYMCILNQSKWAK